MNFSLPNGKVIEVPSALMLGLTDEEFMLEIENLMAIDAGEDIYDLWQNSALKSGKNIQIEDLSEEDTELDWQDFSE